MRITAESLGNADFPALGAFNQWVKDTPLRSWRNRDVAGIAERLMLATAELLNSRFTAMMGAVRSVTLEREGETT